MKGEGRLAASRWYGVDLLSASGARRGVFMKPLLCTATLIVVNIALLPLSAVAQVVPIIVNSAADVASDDGTCTLREAITSANTNSASGILPGECLAGQDLEPDVINFAIPGVGPHTIQPTSVLPTITEPVVIDGYTQPGAVPNTDPTGFNGTIMIELDGSGVGGLLGFGLVIEGGPNTVRGLAVNRFGSSGIHIGPGGPSTDDGGNLIEGNLIGTDITGTAALGNGHFGVQLRSSKENIIGGDSPEKRNVISGNAGGGVELAEPRSFANVVSGNLIGTSASGADALGNGSDGVQIWSDAGGNIIGGDSPAERNIISGNVDAGVRCCDGGSGNVIAGNFIGTDASGTSALGNGSDGVAVDGGVWANTVGGDSEGERNVISGNGGAGVRTSIGRLNFGTPSGVVVSGNFIGTDATGTAALGNDGSGVEIEGPGNIVGGNSPEERNVISGNRDFGILILGPGATDNLVSGNFIGTDASGMAALGNEDDGVSIQLAPGNTIGGDSPEERNIISGNGKQGVSIAYPEATHNLVSGNFIGTDADGTGPLGNGREGVSIGSSGNLVGGTQPGEGNIIAFNGREGVVVYAREATQNRILGNSIHSNEDLGIDLGDDGVTANDPGDPDFGANALQNFPVITSATSGSTTVSGILNSSPNTTFRIEFFSNPKCDPSGYGEGEAFLGATSVTTDGDGSASFTESFTGNAPAGELLTATATNEATGDTSEFSECREVEKEVSGQGGAGSEESSDSASESAGNPGVEVLALTGLPLRLGLLLAAALIALGASLHHLEVWRRVWGWRETRRIW